MDQPKKKICGDKLCTEVSTARSFSVGLCRSLIHKRMIAKLLCILYVIGEFAFKRLTAIVRHCNFFVSLRVCFFAVAMKCKCVCE